MQANQRPKRHCMIVFARYPLGETRVQREAEALLRQGYEVDVICVRALGETAEDDHHGVHIYREPYCFPRPFRKKWGLVGRFLDYIRFFIAARTRLNQLHQQQPYASVQVHNLPDFLVFCASALKAQRVPIILDLHDLMPEFYAGRFGQSDNSLMVRLVRWQERQSCHFADHVITVSEHWRQSLIQRGVPAHKCSVVMNVADEQIFRPIEDVTHSDSEFRLIYHGILVYRYGLDLAIQAVAQLRHDLPNLRLVLIGNGDYVPQLKEMVQQLGLHDLVSIQGLRPAEELARIIQAAHLGIVPYRNDVFTDGLLPTKLMEYAALGLPAIAARTTAIRAYFSDTMVEFFEPGDVDDLADCIRRLYNDPARLAELSIGSEKFNQRYNWATTSQEYVSLVERLGSGKP